MLFTHFPSENTHDSVELYIHLHQFKFLKIIVMKKSILIILFVFLTTVIFGQKIWNFGSDATTFPISAGIGTGPFPVFIDGLSITGISTNVNMGQVELAKKDFTSPTTSVAYSFDNRFKFNGAGYVGAVATDLTPMPAGTNLPTQRYLTVNVTGNSTIYVIGITGSSGSARKLFVTDGTNLVGSVDFPAGSVLNEGKVEYTGPATTLYLFCNSACNLYYLSVTNFVLAGVNTTYADKGITYNGVLIKNSKHLNLEIYDVIGKKIATTNKDFSLESFPKGVYVVKAEGIEKSMKISRE